MDDIDLTTTLLDARLNAPIMVTGMTGGPERAGRINQGIAAVCEKLGLAFGVGSQRLLTQHPDAADTFRLRSVAPNLTIFGNIGVNQARDLGAKRVLQLKTMIEADYMAIHLNPAMELVQPGADSDSDFRAGYETIAALVDALDGQLIVKECGCGLGPDEAARLESIGVRAVDVSGSGGTSWVKVEALRGEGLQAALGETFAEWGIPTLAATTLVARRTSLQIIASGGIDDGLKAAKALAMGARVAGTARPVLQAFLENGEEGAHMFLETLIAGVRMTLALNGVRTVDELRRRPKVIGPDLATWLQHTPHIPAER